MSDAIPHRPQRGIVPLAPDEVDHHPASVTFNEGRARVTYHRPRYVLWQGRPALDLGQPCLATWTAGDGTWDRPPTNPGGRPTQAQTDRRAA